MLYSDIETDYLEFKKKKVQIQHRSSLEVPLINSIVTHRAFEVSRKKVGGTILKLEQYISGKPPKILIEKSNLSL